jgi:beta-glucosidase
LKGYQKTALKAGETKRVSVTLDRRAFAFWSTATKGWHVENGEFEILIGASSRDIRLQASVFINLPETEQYTISE